MKLRLLSCCLLASVYTPLAWGSAENAQRVQKKSSPSSIWAVTGLISDVQKLIISYLDNWHRVRVFENRVDFEVSREFGRCIRSSSDPDTYTRYDANSHGGETKFIALHDSLFERLNVKELSPQKNYALCGYHKDQIFDVINQKVVSFENGSDDLIADILEPAIRRRYQTLEKIKWELVCLLDTGYVCYTFSESGEKKINGIDAKYDSRLWGIVLYDFIKKEICYIGEHPNVFNSPNQRFIAIVSYRRGFCMVFDAIKREKIYSLTNGYDVMLDKARAHYKKNLYLGDASVHFGILDHGYMWFSILIKGVEDQNKYSEILIFHNILQKKIDCFIPCSRPISMVTMSPDKQYFVSEALNNEIKVWDFKKQACIASFIPDYVDVPGVFVKNAVLFDDKQLVVGTGTSAMHINLVTKKIERFSPQVGHIKNIDFVASENGTYIAIGGNQSTEIWQNSALDLRDAYENQLIEKAPSTKVKIMGAVTAQSKNDAQKQELEKTYRYLAFLPQTTKLGRTIFEAWCNTNSDIEKQTQLLLMCVGIKKVADLNKQIMLLIELEEFICKHVRFTDVSYKKIIIMRINELRKIIGQPANFAW